PVFERGSSTRAGSPCHVIMTLRYAIAFLMLMRVQAVLSAPVQVELSPSKDAKQTAFIQRAIDRCGDAGGGKVRLTTGTYVCGSLFLKSRVTLQVEKGAML